MALSHEREKRRERRSVSPKSGSGARNKQRSRSPRALRADVDRSAHSPTKETPRKRSRDEEDERGRPRLKHSPQGTGADAGNKNSTTGAEDAVSENTHQDVTDIATMDISAMMGFSSFGSTKQKKVGPDVGGASISKPSKFRQYINREGGFNRSLSPSS